MTSKEIELIDKEITNVRIKLLKGVNKEDLDQALYDLQIFVFKLED